MEKSSFFNSVNSDRKYKAEDFAEFFNSLVTNGVFPNPSTNLQVIANNNMTITLKSGKAWINGHVYINTDDLVLTIDVADGVLNRIDRLVLRLDTVNREITAQVKKGTFASSPTAPTLQRDADAYELGIADINVAKGIVSIPQSNITDTRLNTSLCGIVNSLIQVDTTTLLNQYESGMQNKEAQFTQDFNTWFTTIKAVLDGDAAGNLLNLINNHKDDNSLHKTANIQMAGYAMPASGGAIAQTDTINQAIGKLEKNAESHRAEIANKTDATKGAALIGMLPIEGLTGDNVRIAIQNLFQFANDGKTAVANAVTAKGVSASPTDTFPTLATKIGQISTNSLNNILIFKNINQSILSNTLGRLLIRTKDKIVGSYGSTTSYRIYIYDGLMNLVQSVLYSDSPYDGTMDFDYLPSRGYTEFITHNQANKSIKIFDSNNNLIKVITNIVDTNLNKANATSKNRIYYMNINLSQQSTIYVYDRQGNLLASKTPIGLVSGIRYCIPVENGYFQVQYADDYSSYNFIFVDEDGNMTEWQTGNVDPITYLI